MKNEIKILNYLTKAYNLFIKLSRQHPDEERDFVDGIHKCQYLLGMRFARKHFSCIFPIKQNPLICPNCGRKMPNNKWRKRKGCQWCKK